MQTHHVLGLVDAVLKRSPGMDGRLEAIRRAHRTPMRGSTLTPNQTRLVREVQDTAKDTTPPPERYTHPAATASYAPARTTPLTPAELAWLDRLPRDPSQVSFEDAKTLATLTSSMRGGTGTTADRRLLQSITGPVMEIHDRNAAEVDLRNAQQAQPPIPASALGALGDAVLAETPDLEPGEALARASKLLQAAADKRANDRALVVQQAQDKITAAKERTRARTAVTR